MTWVLDLEALDANDNPVTLRYSLGRHDDPGDHAYDPRIQQPGLYKAGLYAGQLLSQGRSGFGETTLINADGALDHLADYAVDGRPMTLYRSDAAGMIAVLSGTVSRLAHERGLVSIKLRDPLEPLKTPHPMETYAGDNVLPDGLEGTNDDIGGTPKPVVFGQARNAQPVQVNTALLVYQVSARADCTIAACYDRGTPLVRGSDYADADEMQSVAPDAGSFRCWQGYLRLGDAPVGAVTVDADTSAPNAGDVAFQLASARGWSVAADDVAALNLLGPVRLYVSDEPSTLDLLDRIAASVGGYLTVDASGVLRLSRLVAPTDPVVSLRDYEILDIGRSATGAGDNGLPVHRVTLNADRIETVQSDLSGSVDAARRARLVQQTRPATAQRAATKDRHPLAGEITIDSLLAGRAQAQAVADDLVALLGVRRDVVTVTARLDRLAGIAVGRCVEVVTPRMGYAAGRVLLVTGYRFDAELGEIELNLWG